MSLDSEGGCYYHWQFQELDTRVGLAPLAPWTGLFVWAAFANPLAQLITVALLTGAALACGWVMRRLAPRAAGVA